MKKSCVFFFCIALLSMAPRLPFASEMKEVCFPSNDLCESDHFAMLLDGWFITASPAVTVASGTVVTYTATWSGGCCEPGGTVTFYFSNGGSTCFGKEEDYNLTATLPANPTNGQAVVLGTYTLYNYCESNQVGTYSETNSGGGLSVFVVKPVVTITP